MSPRNPRGGTPPRFLAPGETVGVVAPGFAVRPAPLRRGLDRLRRMGFRVVEGAHLLAQEGYLAGTDEQRGTDLRAVLGDPAVGGVWFARGGYGTSRLLDHVPWTTLRRDPKLLVGYSDLTALFNAAVSRTSAVCLYGPVVTELGDPRAWEARSLRALLRGQSLTLRVGRGQVLAGGRAEGRLVGGNLSVLAHLLGTGFEPDFRAAVLFLEETGEPTYRIDRMLTQLHLAGVLRRLAGVVLGGLDVPGRRRFPPDRQLDDVLAERLLPLGIPVVRGVRAGHVARKITLPLGARATLDADAGRLHFAPRP